MKMKKLMALLLAALLLTGCSAKSMAGVPAEKKPEMQFSNEALFDGYYSEDMDMAYGETYSESMPSTSAGTSQNQGAVTAQKLIRNMALTAETDDLDKLLAFLDGKVEQLGGYMEERSVNSGSSRYRYADMTIRIPVDRMDELVEHISGQSNVISSQESADDITLTYVATQSRVKALEVEQERLLELLAKAENMSDLLQIEERLTKVRTELEEVASRLRLYDNLVDYATVKLHISQVQVFTVVEEETVWQRIGSGLAENWKSLCEGAEEVFVFLITSVPYLIPLGAAAGITAIVVSLATRKTRREKKARAEEDKQE